MLRNGVRAGLLLLALCVGQRAFAIETAQIHPQIEWRVENPFRFFTDPTDTQVHRATFLSLSDEEHETPVLSAERELSKKHADGWASIVLGRTCFDVQRHLYVCPDGTDYINPRSHSIIAELKGIPDAGLIDCTWLTAPYGPRAPRGQAVTRPCSEPVRLDVPYPNGARISVEIGGREITGTEAVVTDLFIVGMGDSFASGEGNPDLPIRFSRERSVNYGTGLLGSDLVGYPARIGGWRQIGDERFIQENARWHDQACHRSLYSHQLRAALQLSIEDPHRAVTFVGVSCSGAEITQGLFLRYKGNEWVPNPPRLSQISAVAEAQCGGKRPRRHDLPEAYHLNGRVPELRGLTLLKCDLEYARKIDLLMISIGGNDVGFSRLVADAVLSDKSLLKWLGGWLGEIEEAAAAKDQLGTLYLRYMALDRAIRNILHIPWEENDRVLLTAYPGLALLEDGNTVCPSGRAGMDILQDFKLSAEKAREGSILAERLNEVMRRAAREHGWTFVESHRKAFLGRGICAGWSDAAFSTADDLRLPRKIKGVWRPYNPADYRPYASRQRWFRTPNDAFLTGNFHVPATLLQKVLQVNNSWFQLVLASTYSGAFHPTAEGQAAIADAVVERARRVLAKYARRSSAQEINLEEPRFNP
jgi:lysophospholipase L1-like esterase